MFEHLLLNQPKAKPAAPSSMNTPLPSFHGRPDENIETWAFAVENQFKARGVDPEAQVALASGLLQGAALQWFYNFQLARRGGTDSSFIKTEPGTMETDAIPPLSWHEFLQELRFAFQPAFSNLITRSTWPFAPERRYYGLRH